MPELDLALLGPPVITRDSQPVSFDTRKATAVLALLAAGEPELSRERLAALLWPDSDSVRARASLRRTLSVTAAAAGPGIRVTRSTVALQPGLVRVDVAEFETLAAAGPAGPAGPLDRAARLYRGDFLAGFALRDCPEFDDWQAATADRLRQRLAGILERLVTLCAQAGELDRALDHARRWLALDQLHEPAHQALIRLLAWTGQRSAALRQYRALVRILDRELAVRPLPETTRLYDDARAGRLAPPGPGTGPPGMGMTRPGPGGAEVAGGASRPSGASGARWAARPGQRRTGHWWAARMSCTGCTRRGGQSARPARWRPCWAPPAAARPGWWRSSGPARPGPGPRCWPGAVTTGRASCPLPWPPTCCAPHFRRARNCPPGCPRTPRRWPGASARNWPPTTRTTWPRWTARWR